jgi:hypothetical protein
VGPEEIETASDTEGERSSVVERRLAELVDAFEELRATTGTEAIQLRARLRAAERRLDAMGAGRQPSGADDSAPSPESVASPESSGEEPRADPDEAEPPPRRRRRSGRVTEAEAKGAVSPKELAARRATKRRTRRMRKVAEGTTGDNPSRTENRPRGSNQQSPTTQKATKRGSPRRA